MITAMRKAGLWYGRGCWKGGWGEGYFMQYLFIFVEQHIID